MIKGYSRLILHREYEDDPLSNCRDITFQVTDDCCLQCSYCYQIKKGHKMMTKEIMKKSIDLLFRMYNENQEDAYINHHTKGLMLNFIGGEPFMNIEVIDYGTQYFLDRCIKENHPWLTNFKIGIASNGLLYFTQPVQDYLKKFHMFIHLTITIDGPQELHDSCRIDKNGNGSFERSFAAFKDWQQHVSKISTKVTIAPDNLPYLNEIFNFFLREGCTAIWANPIHEHIWTVGEGTLYYRQLKTLAEQLLTTYKDTSVYCGLFDPLLGYPLYSTDLDNFCGGNGAMLALDPNGNAYSCLRYMESSLGNDREPAIIGNTDGLLVTKKEQEIYNSLQKINRRTQSTEECFDCHIARGCSSCTAYNYQLGDANKRSTSQCWMHRAKVLANAYYWNTLYLSEGMNKTYALNLSRSIAKKLISNEEYDELLSLSLMTRGGD